MYSNLSSLLPRPYALEIKTTLASRVADAQQTVRVYCAIGSSFLAIMVVV
jgi:hypothetical protein